MNPFLQLILPTLILPLGLSVALLALSRKYPRLRWALPLIWLPAFFWLTGLPDGLPQEAIDWLWPILLLSLLLQFGLQRQKPLIGPAQTGLLLIALVVLSWPLLRHHVGIDLLLELLAVLLVGGIGLLSSHAGAAPALSLAISSGALALVTALGGSLLVGQLSGALASTLGAFALYELAKRLLAPAVTRVQILPLLQIHFALLVIARLYAGIPLPSAALLLIAPVIGLIWRSRFAPAGSAVAALAAVAWLLLTTDDFGY
jgi:hypothetical protein